MLLPKTSSTCNAEDPGSIPESGKSPGGGHGNPFQYFCPENPTGGQKTIGSLKSVPNFCIHETLAPSSGQINGGSEVKASACNAGDLGLIPGLGISPGEGNDNPLQYSSLENPTDGGA